MKRCLLVFGPNLGNPGQRDSPFFVNPDRESSKESYLNARIARIENLVLIALTLKRSDVAPGLVLFVRTRHSALIGLQQITFAIGAAAGVACVNG